MKTKSSELKKRAKQSLTGKYGICAGTILILFVVVLAMSFAFMFTAGFSRSWFYYGYNSIDGIGTQIGIFVFYMLVVSFISMFIFGFLKLLMNICTGQREGMGDMLFAFSHNPLRFIGLYFFQMLIVMLPGIPYFAVFIAGTVTDFIPVMGALLLLTYLFWLAAEILISLWFSQSILLLLDNPDRKVLQCIRESMAMMKGNKGRLFYIYLSFIGLVLLGYSSCGIGFLWILPYMSCTIVHFHLDLKAGEGTAPAYGGTGAGTYTEEPYTVSYEEINGDR